LRDRTPAAPKPAAPVTPFCQETGIARARIDAVSTFAESAP
jgi:hypothetical protein